MAVEPAWMEKVTGVKRPYASAAFYVYSACVIFLFAILWPHLSEANMIKAGLVAMFWATMGFARYLREFSRSPRS